ncbi:MAG TPA: ABC transporter ATP-binding protein [Candidatus Dormibacteraeota bacterium]|jgi:ABC-2 type transport system ATP-binding protein
MSEAPSPAGEAAIELAGVSKAYKIFHKKHTTLKEAILRRGRAEFELRPVLDGVDLVVPHGQSLGIIGRNGVGKSTTLKLIAGLITPDAGTVTVRGRVSTLLELGAGFQGDYTGEENIYLYAALMGLSRSYVKERFDEIVEFSGIGPYIDNMVKTYSSGMYMRLAFAVAVNVDPDLLIVDEVIAVGDQAFQEKCFERTADLRRRGKTIIVVSHDLSSLQRFCDRAIWIEGGKIVADGNPSEVGAQYREAMGQSTGRISAAAGAMQISDLQALDNAGAPVEAVRSGEAAAVRFVLETPIELPGAQMQVRLLNEEGVAVVSGATDPHLTITVPAGREVFTCRFAALPLAAGNYRVDVGITDSQSGVLAHPPHPPLTLSVLGPATDGILAVGSTWEVGPPAASSQRSY